MLSIGFAVKQLMLTLDFCIISVLLWKSMATVNSGFQHSLRLSYFFCSAGERNSGFDKHVAEQIRSHLHFWVNHMFKSREHYGNAKMQLLWLLTRIRWLKCAFLPGHGKPEDFYGHDAEDRGQPALQTVHFPHTTEHEVKHVKIYTT